MKTEGVNMENTATPAADSAPAESQQAESQQQAQLPQIQTPPSLPPRPEPVLDPTDLSDTTESEAEKHGREYLLSLRISQASLQLSLI